jgi:hypothetical protein
MKVKCLTGAPNSLGKGEVDSSILSGSTRDFTETIGYLRFEFAASLLLRLGERAGERRVRRLEGCSTAKSEQARAW